MTIEVSNFVNININVVLTCKQVVLWLQVMEVGGSRL